MLDALSVSAASIISPCAMMPSHTVAVHSLEMSWETIVARLSFLEIPYQLDWEKIPVLVLILPTDDSEKLRFSPKKNLALVKENAAPGQRRPTASS